MGREKLYEAVKGRFEVILGENFPQGGITIPQGEVRNLLWIHDRATSYEGEILIEPKGELYLMELFFEEAFRGVEIEQREGSRSRLLTLMLSSANADTTILLKEPHAESSLGQLFLGGGDERGDIRVTTRHLSPDCQSVSLVKEVVGGRAKGSFRGMVYVAPEAQRTDARQTSRNIELSAEAKITTEPQLEIYADDVKCSHGATVGQLDPEAVLYMRQRGLSEKEARRLQIEGFVAEMVDLCPDQELREQLREAIIEKLQSI